MLPIYVISLKDSAVRRKSIQQQLEILDLKFEFFDAVDGRDGLENVPDKWYDRKKAKRVYNRVLNDTEIACAISHAKLCQKISQSNHSEGAIILEDDAALTFDFAQLLTEKKLENSNQDLIVLFHNFCYVYPWTVTDFFKKYQLGPPMQKPTGTVAYYVTQKGAAAIYENSWPISCVADWGFDINTIGAKMVLPRIVSHIKSDTMPSIIGKRAGRPRPAMLRRLYDPAWIGAKLRRLFAIRVS